VGQESCIVVRYVKGSVNKFRSREGFGINGPSNLLKGVKIVKCGAEVKKGLVRSEGSRKFWISGEVLLRIMGIFKQTVRRPVKNIGRNGTNTAQYIIIKEGLC